MLKTVKSKNTIEVDNIMTLELNTRSNTAKDAVLESWVFDIEDEKTVKNKTLDQLKDFMTDMAYRMHDIDPKHPAADLLMLGQKTMICHIYSHNLAEVFHWLRNIFAKNTTVFTNTWMDPITADTTIGSTVFRFHNTERLVPKTLEEWASDEGLTGNIVMEGMKKYRDKYKHLNRIPVSQAGELRRECRSKITDKAWIEQTEETIRSYNLETYMDLVKCFIGGTMGANPLYKGIEIHDVYSHDLASAYPGVMVSRKFPVSPWEDAKYVKDDNYRYYMVVNFKDVEAKGINLFMPINKVSSESEVDVVEENMHLRSAKDVTLTLTDIDYEIFKNNYTFSKETIIKCRRSKAGYLPKQLVKLILKYYGEKTNFKGTDEVSKYRQAKTKICCFYGVAVTKSITDEISFENEEWVKREIETEEDFNKKRDELLKTKQFLSYQIGVWVTAYVREIMWSIIPKLDKYVVYFDTDCIKYKGKTDLFTEANKQIKEHIRAAMKHHDISLADVMPKGKIIGLFEEEEFSYDFKVIDIKRYAKRTDKGVEAFISGMPKDHIGIKSVRELKFDMVWSKEESGRFMIQYNSTGGFSVSRMPSGFTMRAYSEHEFVQLMLTGNLRNNDTKMFRGL